MSPTVTDGQAIGCAMVVAVLLAICVGGVAWLDSTEPAPCCYCECAP